MPRYAADFTAIMLRHADELRRQGLELWARSISIDGTTTEDKRLYSRAVVLYMAARRLEKAVQG